jgi:hypothetical protein
LHQRFVLKPFFILFSGVFASLVLQVSNPTPLMFEVCTRDNVRLLSTTKRLGTVSRDNMVKRLWISARQQHRKPYSC